MLTNVNVTPLSYSTNGTLGLASVTVDNAVVISSIAIKQNQNGELYVQIPQKFNKNKKQYEDVAFPITPEARDELSSKVLAKYANPDLDMDIRAVANTSPQIDANIAKYQKPKANGQIGAGTLTVNDSFVIRNVSAYQNENGVFYQMPSYKALDGNFKSFVSPASKEMHKQIHDTVSKEINTEYFYKSVDNETFKKLRDICPDLFKQLSGSDDKNVKIKFDKANAEQINDMLGKLSTKDQKIPQTAHIQAQLAVTPVAPTKPAMR